MSRRPLPILACVVGLFGCGSSTSGSAVTLTFAGQAGDLDFRCGASFDGLGASGTTFTGRDFRFYAHDFHLVAADGTEVPLDLDDDGKWQRDGVVLLDFEDGSGPCESGNVDTNFEVVGTAPEGEYTGVRFRLGVPVEMNHLNSDIEPAPLNVSTMFWGWMGGYKYVRIDGSTPELPSFRLHVGATACEGDFRDGATVCGNPNRARVELSDFDVASDVIVADLALLFERADLAANAPGSPDGCMSGADDDDCAPLFSALGLPWAGGPTPPQSFFRVR